MPHYRLALLGYGNVGRAFAALLERKRSELEQRHQITYTITGIASRRIGWIAHPHGVNTDDPGSTPDAHPGLTDVSAWLDAAQADVLFENTSLDVVTGEPAITHIKAALERKAHAITANKGPNVFAYRELRDLAASRKRAYFFESSTLDSIPIYSSFRYSLPLTTVESFRGVFNATSNVVLAEMESGRSFDQAVAIAQQMGIAETDPSADVDGWDSAVKICGLVNVLMLNEDELPIRADVIPRTGIRDLTADRLRAARAEGRPYRLIARAARTPNGIDTQVAPEQLTTDDPFAVLSPSSLAITFQTDIFKELTFIERDPGPVTTAYGLLCDFVNATRLDTSR